MALYNLTESGKSSDVCWKKVPLPTGTAAEGDRNTTTDHHHRAKQHSRCSCKSLFYHFTDSIFFTSFCCFFRFNIIIDYCVYWNTCDCTHWCVSVLVSPQRRYFFWFNVFSDSFFIYWNAHDCTHWCVYISLLVSSQKRYKRRLID